ncbi:hypothetical protein HYPSUDRAFT_209556 [Hypholoma sublateritium FD-334 SS-4]|uniref:Uncharacterized protein n=1 Tax=Hypholoma sublateritium (strain FD-334 SS-4) TaxID=945553 RepID=A0A0D2NY61_HYPSF|nr:hypothetical protein HYPSUDRAFT_209556 [Hypholoma sublateritium FD-334 SS-4]
MSCAPLKFDATSCQIFGAVSFFDSVRIQNANTFALALASAKPTLSNSCAAYPCQTTLLPSPTPDSFRDQNSSPTIEAASRSSISPANDDRMRTEHTSLELGSNPRDENATTSVFFGGGDGAEALRSLVYLLSNSTATLVSADGTSTLLRSQLDEFGFGRRSSFSHGQWFLNEIARRTMIRARPDLSGKVGLGFLDDVRLDEEDFISGIQNI